MGNVYGIDFGTSKSAIAVGRPDGSVVRVRDPASPQGETSVRSSVCLLRDGTLAVGRAAENARRLRPHAYRSHFKRDFGGPAPALLDGRAFRPDELAAEVLRFLRELAEAQVPGPVDRTVVTVPVSWEAGRLERMLRAAGSAGLDPETVELLPEPVAALAHAFATAPEAGENVFAYDLGGGTFDCAVARGRSGRYEVLGAPGGLPDVGGTAFDRLVARRVRDRCGPQAAALLDGPASEADVLRRRIGFAGTCEEYKCQLSVTEFHEDLITELAPPVPFALSRAQLEEFLLPLLRETLDESSRTVRAAGLSWADVGRIVLVGGSSRIPLVAGLLAAETGRPVLMADDPEMAVALGAVAHARRPPERPGSARRDAPRAEPGEVPVGLQRMTRLRSTDGAVVAGVGWTGSRVLMAVGTSGGAVTVMDALGGEDLLKLEVGGRVTALRVVPSGGEGVLVVGHTGGLTALHLGDGAVTGLPGPAAALMDVVVRGDEIWVAVGDGDEEVLVARLDYDEDDRDFELVARFTVEPTGEDVDALCWLPDDDEGSILVTASEERVAFHVIGSHRAKSYGAVELDDDVTCLAAVADGRARHVVAGDVEGRLLVIDVEDEEVVHEIDGEEARIEAVAVALLDGGPVVVSVTGDGALLAHALWTGERLGREHQEHGAQRLESVSAAAVGPFAFVAVGGDEGVAALWTLRPS